MGGLMSIPSSKQGFNEAVCGQQSRTDDVVTSSRMVTAFTTDSRTIHLFDGAQQDGGGGESINNSSATRLSPSCSTLAWLSSTNLFIVASISVSLIPTATIGVMYYLSHQRWKQKLLLQLEEEQNLLLDINAQLDQQEIMLQELQQQLLLLLNDPCHLCDKSSEVATTATGKEETVQTVVGHNEEVAEERDEDTIITSADHDGLSFSKEKEERELNENIEVVVVTSCDDNDDHHIMSDIQTSIVQVAMEAQTPTPQLVQPLSPLSPPSLWSTAATKTNDSSMLLGPARVLPAALVSPDQQRTAVVDAWSSPMECSARSTLKCLSLSTSMSSTTPKYMPFLQTSEVFKNTSSKMLTPQPQRQREQHTYHSIQQVDSRDDDDDEEVGTVVGETMKSSLSSVSVRRIQVAHTRHNYEEEEEEAEEEAEHQQQQRASIGRELSLSIIEGHKQVVMTDELHEKQNQQPEEGGMVRRSICQEEVADKHYTKEGSNKEEKDEAEQEQQQCTVGIVREKSALKNQRHQKMTAGQHQKIKQRYCYPGERINEKVSNYTDHIVSPPNTIRNTRVHRTAAITATTRTPKRKPIDSSSTARLVSGGGWNSNTSQFFTPPSSTTRRPNIVSPGSTIHKKDLQRWKNSLRT